MKLTNLLKRSSGNDTPAESPTRENVIALFESAAMEYALEYTTSNNERIHEIAFGKMLAYRQLVLVLGDEELAEQFDARIDRLLLGRKSK